MEEGESRGQHQRKREAIKVTPENPVHLCPVRERRGCRYGICNDCFMEGKSMQAGRGRRRKRQKVSSECQHDDMDALTCFGERSYFCRRYFEGAHEGGNYPNQCCKCKVSLLGWR